MSLLQVVGMDPSLRNWGIAKGTLTVGLHSSLTISHLDVIQPVLSTGKQVRQNSLDLESARQLAAQALAAAQGAHAIFVEVPVGSQSARAMASYGICVGVLGALRASGIPFFEVTPNEVKMISVGKKTATKSEMIQWAYARHPEAKWPTYKQHGQDVISEAKAEHMADAVAAIHAGLASNPFQQTLPFLRAA
tara:strand:+ start:1717 stop:2292 length:576 start_codon:yes stop_codon:yes gene_type:complete